MTEKKLIAILRTLDAKEMRNFGRFLKGTAKRKSPNQIILFDYLSRYYPEFPTQKMEREYIAQKLFSDVPNSLRKVSDSADNIGTVLKDFLVQEELKVQKTQYNFLLLNAYKRRKLDDSFFKEIEKTEKAWEKEKPEGIEQLYKEYLLKKICFTHPNFDQNGQNRITYEVLIQQLDKYYFAEKLFWTSCLKITEDFVNTSGADFIEKQHLIQEILDICLNENSLQNNPVKFLAEVLNVLVTESFQNYPQLEEQFTSSLESFEESERNDLFELLNLISLRDSTISRQEAFRRAFELNRRAVEKQWIFRNEHLSGFRFLNIVSTACSVGEMDWARYFIDTFGTTLGKDEKSDIVSISHAIVDFKGGLYENVIDRLIHTRFRSILYKITKRAIQLECYYELKFSKLFNSFARAFKDFIQNHRKKDLAEDFAQGVLNFIRFASKLEEKRHEFRPNVTSTLEDIKSCDNVAFKRWLIEKAEELMRR